jgi:hypothetical protein
MEARVKAMLDEAAGLMIGEAQAAGNQRIFSATGFAHENISIVHQQLRCANLAWALSHTKRVKPGDVVAVVGGSFSGLMLATLLAVADDVIIYIFEKEDRLLHKFLDKSHRYLSPNLNSRYLGSSFDSKYSRPFFVPPVFQWSSGAASDVASEWLSEFDRYQRKLPIFTFLGCQLSHRQIKRREGGLCIDLRCRATPHAIPIAVDLLIDATGFGDEANPHGLVDYSYWESGHRLIYDHLPRPCSVLVSGCGDSGLVEAMHYAIDDFRHKLVESLWPSGNKLEVVLDTGLEAAKLDEVLKSEEVKRYNCKIISEVVWWLDQWFGLKYRRHLGWALRRGSFNYAIFHAIEQVLRPRLRVTFPGRKLKQLSWEELAAFALKLPLKAQFEVRHAVMPIADVWISHRVSRSHEAMVATGALAE